MKKASAHGLTPTRLRVILSFTLVLIILIGAGIFYLAYNKLGESASETGQRAATARESQDTLQRLQALRKELESKRDNIAQASSIIADGQNYAYQDRLVNDLTIYATRANLTVKNISFSSQPASSAAAATTDPASELGSPVGLKKATVDITLGTPIKYQDLLNYLHYIELNLTKLKISRVVMTKSEED